MLGQGAASDQSIRQTGGLSTVDVSDFEKWLHRTAFNMTGASDHEDLVQEGRIAIWEALAMADHSHPALAGYVTRAAKGRMIDVVTGNRRVTGHEAPEGKVVTNDRGRQAREKIRAVLANHPGATGAEIVRQTGLSPATVSVQRKRLDIDTELEEPGSLQALADAGYDPPGHEDGLLEMVIQAYMYGEISAALSVLTPNERRYVDLRFWEAYTPAELRKAFGYDPSSIWRSAKVRLRPVLEERLQHLAA